MKLPSCLSMIVATDTVHYPVKKSGPRGTGREHVLLANQFAVTLEGVLRVPDSLLKGLGAGELLVARETDNGGDHTLTVGVGNDVEMSIGGQDGDGAVGASKVDSNNDLVSGNGCGMSPRVS